MKKDLFVIWSITVAVLAGLFTYIYENTPFSSYIVTGLGILALLIAIVIDAARRYYSKRKIK